MIEYYTEAIVLGRGPQGEMDGTVTLYTKELGKVTAFTRSVRRITSKLSGHLMPGNLVRLRIVEQNSIQAVDALSTRPQCKAGELLPFLCFLDEVLPHGEPDERLWKLINGILKRCQFEPATYRYLLGILGFGSDAARCGNCSRHEIAHFSLPDIMFLCGRCGAHARFDTGGLIDVQN